MAYYKVVEIMSEVENLIKKKAEKVDQDFNSILEDIYEEAIEPRIKKRLEFLLKDSWDLMTEIYAEIEIWLSEDIEGYK